jgi:MFS family permease
MTFWAKTVDRSLAAKAFMISKKSLYPWFVVVMLWGVACLNYLDRVMVTTMRETLTAAIPMTDAQFGLLTAAFLWVYGLISPFAGFLSDRFGRSRIILISLFCWSLLTWLTGYARNYEILLIVRGLMGISEAAYIPAALALISDYHRGNTRSFATGIHMTGICVGSGLGGLGGWIAECHSWNLAFILFGVFGIVYAIILMFFLRDTDREDATTESQNAPHDIGFFKALGDLLRSGTFLAMLGFWGLLGMVGWVVVGWMPTYFMEQFHLSQSAAGFYATAYVQAALLTGFLVCGALADIWNRSNPRARILVPAVGLCIAAPGVFLVAKTTVLAIAIAGLVLYGLARAAVDSNMMPALCLVIDSRHRATGYGILNMLSCVIGGLGIYAGGALRDDNVNISTLFTVSAASMLVCAAIMFFIRLPHHPAEE